jgi:hypothetical protein
MVPGAIEGVTLHHPHSDGDRAVKEPRAGFDGCVVREHAWSIQGIGPANLGTGGLAGYFPCT